MRKRRLGKSDLEITPIGLGAWAIGGPWQFGWGPQDDRESLAAIERAVELGVNWIDTAAVYGLGHSEEIVGRALARMPAARRPFVFTKCSLVWDETGIASHSLEPSSLRRECEASLARLGVEAIDLYQIHWPAPPRGGPEGHLEEAFATLDALRHEGKIRWLGVCNFNVAQLERIVLIAPLTSLQSPYSLLRRGIEKETLPWCAAHGLGVLAYSPMAVGILSGAMTRERATNLPAGDFRRDHVELREPNLTANLAFVERLRAIGERHRHGDRACSPGEVAIAWTLLNPAVTAAIVGGRSAVQVEGTAGAAQLELGPEDRQAIERALAERVAALASAG